MSANPGQGELTKAMARVRIAEAIAAHARSLGIPSLPGERLAQMVDTAAARLFETLSASQIASLSSGDGNVMAAAITSFSQVYGQLSEIQLHALRLGIDPANLSAVRALAAGALDGSNGVPGAIAAAVGVGGRPGGRPDYHVMDTVAGVSAEKLASYTAQYGDLGLDRSAVAVFAAIDLNRTAYEHFRKEGYSTAAITVAAADTKALGWKGADAFGDTVHADKGLREAAIAWVTAKDGGGGDAAARERELERVYEGLSPDAKDKSAPFLKRLNETHKLDAERAPAAAAAASDSSLRGKTAGAGTDLAAATRSVREEAGKLSLAADVDGVLGTAPTRPAKPGPGPAP